MEQFTASEVRHLSNRIPRNNDEIADAQEALRAYADMLEAREKAVPVAWRTFDGEGNYDYRDYENNEHYRDWYVSRNGAKYANWVEPLYSHPAPSDAERLAEALQPFANLLQPHHASIPDDRPIYGINKAEITAGDLRRANEALTVHSAQAQPPAASATKRERKGHTEWLQGSEKDGGGTTNYVEPVWVWDEPEQTAASVPDIDTMVNRFLSWRLPKPWNPDNGISYTRPNYAHEPAEHDWPTGTNLFDANQAREMIEHMLAAQENPNGV